MQGRLALDLNILVVGLLFCSPVEAQGIADARSISRTHQPRNAGMLTVTLSGLVIMEDGSSLTEVVQVELVCNGRVNQQTLTGPDGGFHFELGSPRTEDWLDPALGGSSSGTTESAVKVAPAGGGTKLDEVPNMGHGRASLSGCEVRASFRPGYTSNVIALGTRDAFENPEIGAIVLRRAGETKAATVSVSFLRASKSARELYRKAAAGLADKAPNTRKASGYIRKALQEDSSFAAAWDLLGRIQMIEGQLAEARESFLRAIEEEPDYLQPRLALARVAFEGADWQEVLAHSTIALELDPSHPDALYLDGVARYYSSEIARSERSLAKLYSLGYTEKYPFGLLLLGVIRASRNDFEGAAGHIRDYLRFMPPAEVSEAQRRELERLMVEWSSSASNLVKPQEATTRPLQ